MANKKRLPYLLPVSILVIVILGQALTLSSTPTPNPISNSQTPTAIPLTVTLHGAGATFPAPIINFWAQNYTAGHPNVTISYAAVGSGAGQLAAADHVGDFSASDAPLSTAQRPLYPNILHIPETIGSVVMAYNLPGITAHLNLTGPLIAQIFLGAVHLWNDPAIQSLNPGVTLPNQNITTVRRSDGSGTTFVFTSYLSSQSTTWATTVGFGTTVKWPGSPTCTPFPCQITGNGNGGVAAQILANSYTFGYVELNYALTHSISYGQLRNADNTAWVLPSVASTFNAVQNYTATHTLPSGIQDWSGVSMLNQPGLQTYPMSSFTYLLVYRELNVMPSMDLNETTQAQALINFLNWVITTGQKYSELPQNSYVSLPPAVVAVDQASINSITFTINSTPVTHTYGIGANAAGFNVTHISVVSGDTVNLNLISLDGAPHQWFLDFNNNGVVDADETASPIFSSSTVPTLFTFTPLIFNSHSIPSLGNWTFRDANNPTNTGTFTIIPQQIAIPFVPPANSLTSTLIPTIDTSRISTQGSLIVDMRTRTFGGILNETTVDKTSGAQTSTKGFTLSNLHFRLMSGQLQSLFIVKAATSPNATSSDITVTLTGLTGTATYTVSRTLDMASQGSVDIVDLATVAFHYGTLLGQPNYSAASDVNGDGAINIQDLALVAFYFNDPAFN